MNKNSTMLMAALLLVAATPLATARGTPGAKTRAQAAYATDQHRVAKPKLSIRQRLRRMIQPVSLERVAAKDAISWWSRTTGIPVVIDWQTLEDGGIDPQQPISLWLRRVPAGQVLSLITRQFQQPGDPLMMQSTAWYVELITKTQANQRTEVRVYDVADLLHKAPRFNHAPEFNLGDVLGRSGNNGSGGSSGSAFAIDDPDEPERKTRRDRAEDLAQLVRYTIEPDIWIHNGGQYASITVFRTQLVVNAPRYVHEQIGIPTARLRSGRLSRGAASTGNRSATTRVSTTSSAVRQKSYRAASYTPRRYGHVAGVAKSFDRR